MTHGENVLFSGRQCKENEKDGEKKHAVNFPGEFSYSSSKYACAYALAHVRRAFLQFITENIRKCESVLLKTISMVFKMQSDSYFEILLNW